MMMEQPDGISDWDLMKRGQFELAYARMTEAMTRNPERKLRHIYNRGLCLLHMGRLEEALVDFQTRVKLQPDSDSGYIAAGVTLWWLGRLGEAAQVWHRASDSKYTDAAGGVETPALLFFAASRLHDDRMEKEAKALLLKKWRPKLIKIWPGPIAGFLLGKVTEETFLVKQTYLNPTLEARRLCKAHFWVGLNYYRQGDFQKYQYHLQQCLAADKFEPEYFLAKCELQRPSDEAMERA